MSGTAVKEFRYEEGTVTGSYYEVRVYRGSDLVDRFTKPTMRETWLAFAAAGYKVVNELSVKGYS